MKGTQELVNEHRVIEKILTVFVEAAENAEWHDLELCIDFFRGFVDRCHHGKEEQFLLPALRDKGMGEEDELVASILDDHKAGRELIAAISNGLPGASQGKVGEKDKLVENVLAYGTLLTTHIGKEDNELFVRTANILDDEKRAALDEAYADFEHNTLGPDYHNQYHRLADDLLVRYGLLTND